MREIGGRRLTDNYSGLVLEKATIVNDLLSLKSFGIKKHEACV